MQHSTPLRQMKFDVSPAIQKEGRSVHLRLLTASSLLGRGVMRKTEEE
jgi:hypothetical protein